jgi:ribosome-associated protein
VSTKTAAERQPTDLLKLVEKSLDDDKAEDIISIDLAGKSSIADYMVIATGRSARQLNAMAQHLDEKLTKSGVKKVSIEGLTQGEWVLLDGGDVIVHLFKPEVRSFYNLEKMWGVELPEAERVTAVG